MMKNWAQIRLRKKKPFKLILEKFIIHLSKFVMT